MRRILFTILLCLVFVANVLPMARGDSSESIKVIIKPPAEDSRDGPRYHSTKKGQKKHVASGSFPSGDSMFRLASAPGLYPPPPYGFRGAYKPITKCKPSPRPACGSPPCGPICPTCILPRRMPGQWEASTQVLFARLRGTVEWSYGAGTITASDVDFNDSLGLPGHDTFLEYSGRYQLRPSWSLYYSAMPIELEGTTNPQESFTFGAWTFAAGSSVRSKWQFLYQRVGLYYHPINTPMMVVSLGGSWVFNDQRLRLNSGTCSGQGNRVDRTRNLAMTSIEVQNCVVTLPNATTLSSDNRFGIGFLDDTLLLDVQAGFQYSVPMNAGRWGFARGGYRFIDFKEDRNDLRLDTCLEGGFVELGLIF